MTPTITSADTIALPLCPLSAQADRDDRISESIRLAAMIKCDQDITLSTKEGDTVSLSLDQGVVAVCGWDGRLSLRRQYAEDADGAQTAHESRVVETQERKDSVRPLKGKQPRLTRRNKTISPRKSDGCR